MSLVSNAAKGSGAGGLTTLFQATLGVDAASIDTGANGIAPGHGTLLVWITARTADAGVGGPLQITLNNDTSAIYDDQHMFAISTTLTGGTTDAATSWQTTTHGSGGSASYPGVWMLTIPAYDASTFWKVATLFDAIGDATAANQLVNVGALGYRSQTAISRLKIAGGTANLKAGSRLTILGTS